MWFKDKCNEDFEVVTVKLGRRQRAEEQIDTYDVPYRNSALTIHSGTYKPYTRTMELLPMNRNRTGEINKWLSGRGKLRTELEPDGYFIASVITGLPYEEFLKDFDSFQVGFKVDPFFYLDMGDEKINIVSATSILNLGNVYSEPIIKVYGTGDISLNINSNFINLNDISDYVVIDSELKLCYRDTVNMGAYMDGDYATFQEGQNNITWTGNVTKIEITPKWREL